jgi:hypothetical protein
MLQKNQEPERITVQSVTLPELCALNDIRKLALLELDVEGAEFKILEGLSHEWPRENVEQITVDFHGFMNPSLLPQVHGIMAKLKQAGFYLSRRYRDVLLLKSSLLGLPW